MPPDPPREVPPSAVALSVTREKSYFFTKSQWKHCDMFKHGWFSFSHEILQMDHRLLILIALISIDSQRSMTYTLTCLPSIIVMTNWSFLPYTFYPTECWCCEEESFKHQLSSSAVLFTIIVSVIFIIAGQVKPQRQCRRYQPGVVHHEGRQECSS